MTVSILVPIYNVESYIGECAESLFSQSYPDIEYIFVDDCSPDGSVKVLETVAEKYPSRCKHITILHQPENMGLGAARVRALQEVKTDCFMIVDSDDVLTHDAVSLLVTKMKESNADIVEGAHQYLTDGKLLEIQRPYHGSAKSYSNGVLSQRIRGNNVWAKLYKSSVVEKVPDLFVEGIDFAEDFSATVRLVAVCSRAWIDDVVLYYRKENQSFFINQLSEKKTLSFLRAYSIVWSFFKSRNAVSLNIEIGMLNAYRVCHIYGVEFGRADEVIGFRPSHIATRILFALYHSKVPYSLTDVLYRAVRLLSA